VYGGDGRADFADYVARRPSELRNTCAEGAESSNKAPSAAALFVHDLPLARAIRRYETVYAASWKPCLAVPRLCRRHWSRLAGELHALRLASTMI